jgi:hypothetical protein
MNRGTTDIPLDVHKVAEEVARVQGDILAGQRSAFLRPLIPQDETLLVPPRHQIVASDRYTLDAGARLILGENARLIVLGEHVVVIPTVVDRVPILGFNSSPTAISGYLLVSGVAMQAGLGYVMQRAGWVVGASYSLNCTIATSPGSFVIRVRKNGVDVFSVGLTINSTGIKTSYLTQAKGLSPFVAGDVLSFYADFVTFVGTVDDIFAHALLEVA